MSNERIDEFLSWRGRLEDPAGVPGRGLDDREVVWERLIDRIAEKPRRRLWGYRLAAACVLLALAVGVWRVERQRHAAIVRVKQPKSSGPVMASPGIAHAADTGRPLLVAVPETTGRKGGKRAAAAVEKLAVARVGQPADKEELSRLDQAVPLPDSGVAAAAPKQLKKNLLRVVNINELSGSTGPAPAVTTTESSRHFEIFILPGQSHMALPPPPAPADPALLKVKLSSN